MKSAPTFREEASLWRQGLCFVAGVDEVGRGPLAGPVAAGAVILPPRARLPWLRHVRDSKELTANAREELAACIWRDALAVGIGFVSHDVIDDAGIAKATRGAMLAALGQLPRWPEYVLIDAIGLPALSLPQKAIVGGDARCRSIACASIVAKVARDRLMVQEAGRFSGYGFAHNKGYATRQHLEALRRLGPCDIHRRSFAPVRESLSRHSDSLSLRHSLCHSERSEESRSREPETIRYAQGDKRPDA